MAAPGQAYLLYSLSGDPVEVDLSAAPGNYRLAWLDSASAALRPGTEPVVGGKVATLSPPEVDTKRPWVAWLTKQ